MASIEKVKKKKKGEMKPSKAFPTKKNVGGIPAIEEPEIPPVSSVTQPPTGNTSLPGSVISVKDANEDAKADNFYQNGAEHSHHAAKSDAPPPAKEPEPDSKSGPVPPDMPPKPTASKLSSRPSSAASQTARPGSATVHPAPPGGPLSAPRSIPDFTADGSRPPSAASRAFVAPEEVPQRPGSASSSRSGVGRKNVVEPKPVNGAHTGMGSQMGSAVSMQSRTSREVWMNGENESGDKTTSASRATSAVPRTRPPSAATSVISVGQASQSNRLDDVKTEAKPIEIVPADMNEAHAYVPYLYARDCIAQMMEDMKHMKKKHITIVTDIEENYQHIEKETQGQFNTFVLSLRQQYGGKVKTFRQVIEVHRAELQNKQTYWDEALTSLSAKNKQLLNAKKGLLIQNKIEYDRLSNEKEEVLQGTLVASTNKDGAIEQLKRELQEKDNEYKIVVDELESEKGETTRLKTEIDALKNRPKTVQSERVVVAAPGGDGGGQVIVTDMSQAERDRMEDERRQMDREREDMKRERARVEKERDAFISERKRFQEEHILIQGNLNNANRDSAIWKTKHDALREQLGDYDDWRKRYEVLLAQYEAVCAVAEVNTEGEKQQCEEKMAAAAKERLMMEEQKQAVERDVKQWETHFSKQHGRAPTQADRSDSAEEAYVSLEEATHMVNKLAAQVSALEALRRGDIPAPPSVVHKQVIEIRDTQVTTVEIKVPDPELLAHIEMTQNEMDAMKKQLTVLKNDKSDLSSEKAKLQQQVSDQDAHITQLNAAIDALNNGQQAVAPVKTVAPVNAVAPVAAMTAVDDSEAVVDLERRLREKEKELRDLELTHKDELRHVEKDKRGLEKDLKKALRALAKAEKGSSREESRLRDLLAIVAAQVREINVKVNKAAQEVDTRLTNAQTLCDKTQAKQETAKQSYESWEIGWAEENEREPTVQDVEGDNEGSTLHKALSSTNKKAEADEMLVEALTLIKTGAVPEHKQEVQVEKASPAQKAADARPAAAVVGASEEQLEAFEQTISELEKRIEALEDEVKNVESERDLVSNENKELEDRLADLLAQIEKLRANVEQLKLREQELLKQVEEQRLQHECDMREQARAHVTELEVKDEEHKQEKREMEKDIRKLCKLIDKLKKKLQEKEASEGAPSSDAEVNAKEKERQIDDLEDKVTELEDKMSDFDNDKKQLRLANQKLEEKLETVTRTLTTTETEIAELGASASAASAAESEARHLRDDLDALRKRIKELEHEVRVKSKKLREQEFQHEKDMREKERENKEMKNDIEKLVKLIDRLRKRIKDLSNKTETLLDDNHELNEDVKDRDFEIEWRKKNPEIERPKSGVRPKKKQDDFEEIITELKTKVQYLEGEQEVVMTTKDDFQADYEHVKTVKSELEKRVEQLEEELSTARQTVSELMQAAQAQKLLDRANRELDQLRNRLRSVEAEVREREHEVKDKDIALKKARSDFERQLREKENVEREMKSDMKKLMKEIQKLQKKQKMREGPDLAAVSENDEEVARLEKQLDTLEDQLQQLQYKYSDLQTENKHLQADKDNLQLDNKKLEAKLEQLRNELELERERIHQSVRPLSGTSPVPMLASTPDAMGGGINLEDYTNQIHELQKQLDKAETDIREEKTAHDVTKQELDDVRSQLNTMKVELENEKSEAHAKQDSMAFKKDAEIDNLNKKLADTRKRLDTLEHEKLKALPPDAAKEIKDLKARLAASEKDCDTREVEKADLSSKVRELIAKIKSLENSNKNVKTHSSDAEMKIKVLRQEKDRAIKRIHADADKKERERALQEQKKIGALEQRIRELQYAHTPGGAAKLATTAAHVAKGDHKVLEERLRDTKRENNELNTRLKAMEKELKTASRAAGGGASDLTLKKQEKLVQELMKKLDDMTERKKKLDETVSARDSEIKSLDKDNKKKDSEIERLKAELAQLGVAAAAAVEQEQRRKELEKEVKVLREENKTMSDSYNTERVLRKKYYNMVEDMKGKIRVYTRVRPMSSTELQNGNHNVAKSPDEYTVQLHGSRGIKEWQFDQIFMPDSTQEKVFEDTNNLVQSAVDGYNVCIFAYGQTGSGKTFTIIGDREQRLPGIAPRAFNRIFQLLDENKAKFKYSVSCYMLELYNDKLLDLFAKPGAPQDEKLEIKKDKKGMVMVSGSEIKAARNPKELYALFDSGTLNRHTASTKMNAESSRSHLVIGIIIETTNRSSGTVMRGKLSLVDLAGSERVGKTGAGAEQLKEAMSINKSLSALGDVISALSSEQSFIPYRNNKLTMLMQDSLGGNAKTLMFVNISPADYNCDESAISLTYAARVKLITNDAQKNSDNKEISRLKSIIQKMKTGQAVEEEVEED